MSPIPNFEEDEIINHVDSNLTETKASSNFNLPDATVKRIGDNKPDENSYTCLNDNKTAETMEGKCIDLELSEATEVLQEVAVSNDLVHRVPSVNAINATDVDNNIPRDTSSDALSEARVTSSMTQIANINPELCGMPLNLFTKVRNERIVLFT